MDEWDGDGVFIAGQEGGLGVDFSREWSRIETTARSSWPV